MTMTRKEWFEEIVARVQNPQNKEKREKQRNNKMDIHSIGIWREQENCLIR